MENNIKGVKVITLNLDRKGNDLELVFDTLEEAIEHYDHIYMNSSSEEYAENVLYPILCALKEEEFDEIDNEGYAIIEMNALGVDYEY